LAAIPGVKSVAEQIGRSENGQDPDARNKSEFGIQLDPARSVSTEQLDARVRTLFDLGGLVSSTLVALVLVPPLAARWLRQGCSTRTRVEAASGALPQHSTSHTVAILTRPCPRGNFGRHKSLFLQLPNSHFTWHGTC
jgi:hypothetical protein